MLSGKKMQIFSQFKWRIGKKQKKEKKTSVSQDDIDCDFGQFKQEPVSFWRSRSEDSGLDLSNPTCLYQERVSSDVQETNSEHSRHTSNSSSLYSFLSCGSRSGLYERSLSCIALSDGERESKMALSPLDDEVFEMNNVPHLLHVPPSPKLSGNFAKLTVPAKADHTVTDVSKSKTTDVDACEINSNNWYKKTKWNTIEEPAILEKVGCNKQLRQNKLETKITPSASSEQLRMGMLSRLCSLMEKITELERDRLQLLKQNHALQDQLSESQRAQVMFLSCCTCVAGPGLNTPHTGTRPPRLARPPVTRRHLTPQTGCGQLAFGSPSEVDVEFECGCSQQLQDDTVFTPESPALDALHLCVSSV
ncbi:uncharacterized protein LOC144599807 [Rhinoraja longicauda]